MIIRVIQINNDYNFFKLFNNSRYLCENSSVNETLNNSHFYNISIKDNSKSYNYSVNINGENKLNKEINNTKKNMKIIYLIIIISRNLIMI
ncbi:serine/threonine protein kinase, FIKK family, putative [Plasmodium gaboni]|uniref:Serine/threonine protein kinase, FIKK family, putative n=1 Tax=Plasmodium gaboni TaxID=647221 RepID=A0ABY0KWA0_9APIC|nr:serine/threonine protein kinase, FIKK family, putative [Plasmodium gaboni]